MRLLNTSTFILKEFFADFPKYVILSHTWGDDEITFQDIQRDLAWYVGARSGIAFRKFAKIKDSCEKAASHGYEYIWIDTCCIDKTSSSELSEAINSMFRWYRRADVCYAYLADVDGTQEGHDIHAMFRKSRWFTRGWTLQELIAPRDLCFYDKNWVFIGAKTNLLLELAGVTGIEVYALRGGDLQQLTVARRMSWMADRQTTRTEDMAYCLLGIFAISMPMLYGESNRAFIRLQEEIMKSTGDQSLFAWESRSGYYYLSYSEGSLFAPSPALVRWPKSIAQFRSQRNTRPWSTSTYKGLQTHALICHETADDYFMVLDCPIGFFPGVLAGVKIKRLSAKHPVFARVGSRLFTIQPSKAAHYERFEGFDPEEDQKELLVEGHNGETIIFARVYLDWEINTIYIGSDTKEKQMPESWIVVMPPLNAMIGPVSPPHLWDANTRTLRSTPLFYPEKSRCTGTISWFFVRPFEGLASQGFILILGNEITSTGDSAAFCLMIPGSSQDLPSSPEDHAHDKLPATPRYFFDETAKIYSICSHEDITCIVEPKTLSGREMYLVRVFYSDHPPADLQDKWFHANPIDEYVTLPGALDLNYDFRGRCTDGNARVGDTL